jgi:hypothetical protein
MALSSSFEAFTYPFTLSAYRKITFTFSYTVDLSQNRFYLLSITRYVKFWCL